MKAMLSLLLLVFVANVHSEQKDNESTYWTRGVFRHPAEGYTAAHRFQLWVVTFDKGRLTGRFSLYQITEGNAPSIKIKGRKTVAGTYFPQATLQVEDPALGKWKTVRKNCDDGKPATVTVKSGEMNPDLYVCLDVYRSFLKTHKRGRVVLDSGDTAVFELSDLTPNSR